MNNLFHLKLRGALLRDEGLVLKPYHDSVGKLTIGVGRNLDDVGISTEEATMMLEHDIARIEREVMVTFPWSADLDDPRRGVLVNMAFNLGTRGLGGFRKALAAMQRGDWDSAATEMLASKWATQTGARAERLAQQMRSGTWA